MNSQSEMNGILSIMNDFVSWHVETYGVGLEVYSGENEQIVIAPGLGEQAASLAEAVVGAPYLGGGKGYDWKEGKFVESNDILHGYHWNWQDHSEVEKGVDCSGLVFWAFNKAAGATQFAGASNPIPGGPPDYAEGASGQWKKYVRHISTKIPTVSDLRIGYLLYLDTNENGKADHVGMYVGNGYVSHSTGRVENGKVVGVEKKTLNGWLNLPVPGGKYKDYFLGYGRVKAALGDKFNIGDIVRVTTNLNVRPEPGSSIEITDPDYPYPGYAPTGTIGIVLSGPSSADSYIWWEVDYGPGLYTGWTFEC
jgi:cell wall-associated NlpC family hydrolase